MKNTILTIFCGVLLIGCGEKKTEQIPVENPVKASAESTKKELPGTKVTYEVIWESNSKRYDHAKSFIVVMPNIIRDKDDYKSLCHYIVNDIANKEKTKKFSVDILDDKETGVIYKESHYGASTVGRIANKKELALFAKHVVGAYVGELEAMGEPYEMDYYDAAPGGSHEVYEPVMQ